MSSPDYPFPIRGRRRQNRFGIHPEKYRIRAAFRAASMLAVVVGFAGYNYLSDNFEGTSTVNTGNIDTALNAVKTKNSPLWHGGDGANFSVEYDGTRLHSIVAEENIGRHLAAEDTAGGKQTQERKSDDPRKRSQGLNENDSPPAKRNVWQLTLRAARGGRELQDIAQDCDNVKKAEPASWKIPLCIGGILYLFLALAIVCDDFFVPALEEMSSERHLNLSMDIAGATLMAAGGSAPELFTSLFGTFGESEVGFGTIVGSAVFNVLFVIGMCSLLSKETLTLTWWPLFRDSSFYSVGLVVLAAFVGVISKGEIQLWEALVLFALYLGYITLMYFNRRIYTMITGKELSEDGRIIDENDDTTEESPFENGSPNHDDPEKAGVLGRNDSNSNRPTLTDRPPSTRSIASVHSLYGPAAPVDFRWPGTFRAGVLKLLRNPDSWVDTAGVGIVSKMAGDVDHVFKIVDQNGDGEIDKEELSKLFERLDCHVTESQMDDVFRELDKDGDGLINEKEFTEWYIHSEERIKSKVKKIFDQFDEDQSGTIDRIEVRRLLEKLEPRVTEQDVDDALQAMYKEGSTEEITFEEFAGWYVNSLIFEKQAAEVEEEFGPLCDAVKPPFGGGLYDWVTYIVLLPLVATLTFTVPDVRRPGNGKYCYLSFVLSIGWIGTYSFFMVDWAERVGNTIGIPSVVMGLTFLAAGTSVPDLLSSVIVARRGEGDMAVSSSIGSNIFDILVGLPIPWIIYTAWPSKPDIVTIGSDGVWVSIFVLLGMLVFIIIAIHWQGWKLTKTLGGVMFVFYILFLIQAIVLELPFETC